MGFDTLWYQSAMFADACSIIYVSATTWASFTWCDELVIIAKARVKLSLPTHTRTSIYLSILH